MSTASRRASLAALVLALASGSTGWAAEAFGPANPFYAQSTLPFHAPPFNIIRDTDYRPAIEAGMLRQRSEVRAIADNRAKPTFQNTLLPLEQSGALLARAERAFNAVAQANTNPVLQAAKTALAPQLAAHYDAIYLDPRLFARISAVRRAAAASRLDAESRRLLDVTYDEFVHAGANLPDAGKQKLQALNEEASTLSDRFTSTLLAATKDGAFRTTSAAALSGFTDARRAAAAAAAAGRDFDGYLIPLQNTTQQPDLASLTDRDTRRALFDNSWRRAERGDANDTRDIIIRLARIRAARAALLGFANHAAWKLQDQMAKTPEAALTFMAALLPLAAAKSAAEGADIQAWMDSQAAGVQLEPWDWNFFASQVRKAKFALDDAEVKPYFELRSVLENGVFYAANQLYGITFTERKDIPVYQADVRVFEVHDVDGKPLALFYCDYFKRDNKNGGAWMSNFVAQSTLLRRLPVIYNVANLPKPAAGEPALLSFEDVRTVFHEFGHALHGMFADTRYPSLSGTATARDFVEFPSQFNEHWALYPAVFTHYAKHYQTGTVMPPELVERIKRAENFGAGYRLTELLAAAELDMQWHTLTEATAPRDVDEFESEALSRAHVDMHLVPPRYRSSYFSHIWGGGYAAAYYAYLWTQMLDDDAYQWFDEHGGLTRANGERFRRMVLSRGNTRDLAALYAAWRGRPPSIDAMIKYRELPAPTGH